jgi:hypothetical protein
LSDDISGYTAVEDDIFICAAQSSMAVEKKDILEQKLPLPTIKIIPRDHRLLTI